MEKGAKFLNFAYLEGIHNFLVSSNFNADIGHHQWCNG